MEVNKIWEGDCIDIMKTTIDEHSVDVVLTSPPYNTSRSGGSEKSLKHHWSRYVEGIDQKKNDDYCDWTVDVFNGFDRILKPNGVVLYNISYGSENVDCMWLAMADIIRNTNFSIADCIIWKKRSALPNNTSPNSLTRITEFVFVLARTTELGTYKMNKKISSVRENGQVMYSSIFNFIEAANNDGNCEIHKATYSTELCHKLLMMYCPENGLVFDPFMGTGTTAVACIRDEFRYIGTEIFHEYVEYADNRIKVENSKKSLKLF